MHDAIETLCASVIRSASAAGADGLAPAQLKVMRETCGELNARSLVSLVKWLQSDSKYTAQLMAQIQQLVQDDDTNVLMVAKSLKVLSDLEDAEVLQGKGIRLEMCCSGKGKMACSFINAGVDVPETFLFASFK